MQSNRRLQLHMVQTPMPASLPAVLISKAELVIPVAWSSSAPAQSADHPSPSMTKSNGAARQWKIFPSPNLHTHRSVPSPTSTGNEGSVTSVDTEPPRHRHMVAQVNPVLSSPSAELLVYGFTYQRSSTTRNSYEGSDESEWTNSSNRGDVKKQRLNVSSGSKWSHGRKTEERDPAHEIDAIIQAAAALVKLCSDEIPAGEFFRRSFSSPKTTDRLDCCGEILLQSGETRPEDATAASVLPRPCSKRCYRMMEDLLAETPTVCDVQYRNGSGYRATY